MKNTLLKLAVIGAFGFTQYAQAGWVTVPSTGFTGSAYTNCYNAGRTAGNPKGNFVDMWGQVLHCDISDFRLSPWPDHYA